MMKFEQIVGYDGLSFIGGIFLGILYLITYDLPCLIGCVGLILQNTIIRYGRKILKKLEDNP